MSIQTKCPGCRSPYSLPDNLEGKKVRCKKCERTFVVGGVAAVEAADDWEDADEEGEEDRVRQSPRADGSSARRRDEDDEDDFPPRRRRRHDDDEEEDEDRPRPRRRRKKSGNPATAWIIGGVGAGALLLVAFVVAAVIIYHRAKTNAQAQGVPQGGFGGPANPAPQAAGPNNPNAGPAGAQGQGANQPSVVLSNGRITRAIGARKAFSIDYRFERGGPAAGFTYRLVIKSPGGDGSVAFHGHELHAQGTFSVQQFGIGALNDTGPYDAFLEIEQLGGGPFAGRQQISNTIRLQ
jgi:hypothetical protein